MAGDGRTTRLFLYGTLMHPPHLAAILGREAALAPAVLPGFRRGRAGRNPWPTLAPEQGSRVEGLTLEATREDLVRLDRHQAAHDHARRALTLADGEAADAYALGDGAPPSGPWSLEDWARDWGPLWIEAAEEAMGIDSPRNLPSIRRRAAARLAARGRGPDRSADVEVIRRERPYSDFYALDAFKLRHRRFDGGWSPPLSRAVLVGFDAVIVLPYDPARDRVLVVEQFRVGRLGRGAPDPWAIEPVAGLLDAGETPEDCARREAREEAGVEIGALHRVASGYACPGNVTEYHHSFVGVCDLPDGSAGLGGLAEEHEDIRGHLWPAEDLAERVSDGRIDNGPMALCAMWLLLHRERLRG